MSVHQNDMKTPKIYQFKKKIQIFLKILLKLKNKQDFTKLN